MIRVALLLTLALSACADPLAPCNPHVPVPVLDASCNPVVTASVQVCP